MRDNTARKPRYADPIITVNTVFVGKQSDRDAFIDLIAQKAKIDKSKLIIDKTQIACYTDATSKKQDTQANGGKI